MIKIKINSIIFIITLIIGLSNGFFLKNLYPPTETANRLIGTIDSKPLFLTPYIESGQLDKGRRLSEVVGLSGLDLKSYSGFLTVNKTYDSNMFFWFFPALTGKNDVPVLLWLQGGPGGSSLFGLFVENGPIKVSANGTPYMRDSTWNREFAVLYIDNPVGTGFSFTKDDRGYATNEVDVAENLYEALRQFFTLYYEYKGNPFFLTGESYAGKYVPAIGYKIHYMGKEAEKSGINLQGLAIGDGLSDPRHMLDYGDYLYQVGLIDEIQRAHFKEEQRLAIKYIDDGQMLKAAQIFDRLLVGDFDGKSYFYNATGLNFYYNILYDRQPDDFGYYSKFLASAKTRESIHVGNLHFGDESFLVLEYLLHDVMASVSPWVEQLLDENYRTMFYTGQLDIIVAAPLTENFLRHLKWKRSDEYRMAKRSIYRVSPNNPSVAGYVRQAGNLYQVIIRNAGHILPYDQPKVASDMITRFVKNESF
ncbi:putative serine carboxypeptidase CPVL [Dermatophagoides farinae]|uniref:putative serine carboxypeptidase CPVL n=1 Tax=Dermatophagoides farinae TaxID=6954 RepID=UPI003F5DBACB